MARKDIDLSFRPHPLTGDLTVKTGRAAVDQSLRNLVMTNIYERGFNKDIYTNVSGSLFENMDDLTLNTIKHDVESVIEQHEPDVDLVDVIVNHEENSLKVDIFYNYANDPEPIKVTVDMVTVL